MSTHIWLRSESKPSEKRTVLPPSFAAKLLDSGFRLTVEQSSQSIFDTVDYESVGCEIVEEHSWRSDAPRDAIILGLKELEASDTPLQHRHIHFAHVYKNQAGWEKALTRYQKGGGALYDLEFLVDDTGKRVAAFGYWAGFAGAGLATLAWCNQQMGQNPALTSVGHRNDKDELINELKSKLANIGESPTALIIGALGRCGCGAKALFEALDVKVTAWDLQETSAGGPFSEIIEHEIFLNCVFVDKPLPPFIDFATIKDSKRKLNVICDVSCDPYGDYNPVPIYDRCTTFDDPIISIINSESPLDLIAIDHLPSLLPKESSRDFCEQLMPYLLELNDLSQGVWGRAKDLFKTKTASIGTGVN